MELARKKLFSLACTTACYLSWNITLLLKNYYYYYYNYYYYYLLHHAG